MYCVIYDSFVCAICVCVVTMLCIEHCDVGECRLAYLMWTTIAAVGSIFFFFLMIRRPPRSTLDRSSAASDVYKRQVRGSRSRGFRCRYGPGHDRPDDHDKGRGDHGQHRDRAARHRDGAVSYTHLRAHETVLDLVCRLLLEKKNKERHYNHTV